MKRLRLYLLLSAVGITTALAIIDTNNNGVSDFWETNYNSGNLFATFDPQADPDGDGWTNAQEATAGTNPFDANPPAGFISPDIVHTAAVLGDLDNDSIEEIITPEAATITWPTLVGKQYTLLASPDLLYWGVYYAGIEMGDLNASHDYTGDGISAEELSSLFAQSALGTGNPQAEYLIQPQYRFNKLSNAYYHPPVGTSPGTAYGQYVEGGLYGSDDITQITELTDLTDFSPAYLEGHIAGISWLPLASNGFAEWTSDNLSHFSHSVAGFKTTDESSYTGYKGFNKQGRLRVMATRLSHASFTQSAVKLTSKRDYRLAGFDLGEAVSTEVVTISIQKGRFLSDWFSFEPPVIEGRTTVVSLVPVEIEQQDYNSSEGIRFCRWLDSFHSSGLMYTDAADNDRDRFRIRIPQILPNVTKIRIKATDLHGAMIDGAFVDTKTTDGDYDVDLVQENGAMVSKWILLVSDGDDDKYYNGGGTDVGPNDQTLLADFDSKIIVTFPELNNAQAEFRARKAVGKVTLNIFYMSPAGDVPQLKRDQIVLQIRKMREIYRQIGIQVLVANIKGEQIPQQWLDAKPTPDNEAENYLNRNECLQLNTQIRSQVVPEKQIRIGYVDAVLNPEGTSLYTSRGWTYRDEDGITVSLRPGNFGVLGVTAHEVGHTLGLDHVTPHNLMMKGGELLWNNKAEDSKRFQENSLNTITSKTFYYVPIP